MQTLFGTDGIRGRANQHPLDAETALHIGRALTALLRSRRSRPEVVIGRDTRISGPMLVQGLAAGIASVGGDTIDVGVCSTPCVAFLTRHLRADAGVVISASHNPFEDNGIKIFDHEGFKLPDEREAEIERMLVGTPFAQIAAAPDRLGGYRRLGRAGGDAADPDETYIDYLARSIGAGLDLRGQTIVVDGANGGAYRIAPALFERLGARVLSVGVEPTGTNINDGCGSQYPDDVRRLVRQVGATMGVALDGDADRLIAVDERGETVDGDMILALVAEHYQKTGQLKRPGVVATVMSNIGLEEFLTSRGIELVRTAVGDRYVVERMRKDGYNLGGEQSGHLLFTDHTTTGDGVLAALQLLVIMRQTGKPLSELASRMTRYPQTLKNFKVREKRPLDGLKAASALIREVERELGARGRVLVRYSGTEAKVRVMVEGPDVDRIEQYAERIGDRIVRDLDET